MSDTASGIDQARSQAGEMAGQAQEKVQQAAQEVKGRAGTQVREQVDTRSSQAGEQVRSVADALRQTGGQLREQENERVAKVVEQAADRVERVGSYLTESDAERILRDAENFARQRPWAVIAGGIALGLAASRFLKASSVERYQVGGERPTTPAQLPATTTYGEPTASTPPSGHPAGTGAL